jgi:tubulin polyglutamylase TTLL1/tubulin monoglycylase TTLL3/8
LFQNLNEYYISKGKDPFEHIPVTFHLASSTSDPEFARFLEYAETQNKKKNLWIIKPGEFTNRGNGIVVEKGVDGVKEYL